ncbi:MAG: hypothetical protein OXL36_19615 [Bryobacterales bacterium]|nr:hypothetical protein [Bryobacterales bacterium]
MKVVSSDRLVICGAAARNGHDAFPLNAARPREEIELSEFWCTVESNLPTLTALGVLVTIVLSLLQYRSTKRYNLPMVSETQPIPQADLNYWLRFNMEPESKKWLVTGIRIRRQWRRHLSKPTDTVRSKTYGEILGYIPGPWCRYVRFDPPVRSSEILLHRDTPKAFWLCFDVCLSSDPKAKNRVVKRVVITD